MVARREVGVIRKAVDTSSTPSALTFEEEAIARALVFEIAQSAACLIRLAISLRLFAANKAFNLRAFAIELSE